MGWQSWHLLHSLYDFHDSLSTAANYWCSFVSRFVRINDIVSVLMIHNESQISNWAKTCSIKDIRIRLDLIRVISVGLHTVNVYIHAFYSFVFSCSFLQYIVERHGKTLLPQYLGMYRLTVENVEYYLVAMRNVFSSHLTTHR